MNFFRATTIFAVAFCSSSGMGQDPAKVAANNYKVALENDSVRVLNLTVKPGEKIAMHSHPDHLVYHITAGKVKFTDANGKTKEVEMKAGEATYAKAETHQPENIGSGELKYVIFELKKPAGSTGKAPAGDDQMKVAADSSKVVFENERVRLLEAKMKAGNKMAKHTHPAYVTYALKDAKAKMTVGDKTDERTMKAGEATWSEPLTHAVENVGGDTHTLVLEIK